jgi:hypothetical protein
MNSFKYKKDKKKIVDKRMTILSKHAEMLATFELLQKTLPKKYEQLNKLKSDSTKYSSISNKGIADFTKINRISYEIGQLEKEIQDIKLRKAESEYITRVTPILIQYENMSNLDEDISPNESELELHEYGAPEGILPFQGKTCSAISIAESFKNDGGQNPGCGPGTQWDMRGYEFKNILSDNKITNMNRCYGINNYDAITKHDLWKQYMLIVDPSQVILKSSDLNHYKINEICPECNIEGNQIQMALYVECGMYIYINRIDHETLSYKDNDRLSVAPPYVYKRINHFNEWLSQFQAKETTNIPQSVYDNLVREFKKYRIDDFSKLNPKKIRNILKHMGAEYTKYYEHVPHIICKINKLAPPRIDAVTEDRLRLMFKEVQEPYEKYRPKNRKNFLSYSYILHKFFELLELDQYLEYFPYLKDPTKLRLQDDIFKKICGDLKWEYIPSI